jgi:hypothetical protein
MGYSSLKAMVNICWIFWKDTGFKTSKEQMPGCLHITQASVSLLNTVNIALALAGNFYAM